MNEKKFKQLVEKNLHVLEGYEIDKNGNTKRHIVGIERLHKQLSIAFASQQRELLLDFLSKVNGNLIAHPHLQMNTDFVDDFLKYNNCS